MKQIKSYALLTAQIILLGMCGLLFLMLSLDALEWESTGACQACNILPVINPRFTK